MTLLKIILQNTIEDLKSLLNQKGKSNLNLLLEPFFLFDIILHSQREVNGILLIFFRVIWEVQKI